MIKKQKNKQQNEKKTKAIKIKSNNRIDLSIN